MVSGSVSAGADCSSVGGPLVGGGIKKCVYVEQFFNLIFYYCHTRSGNK
jgi:hypothetical protein